MKRLQLLHHRRNLIVKLLHYLEQIYATYTPGEEQLRLDAARRFFTDLRLAAYKEIRRAALPCEQCHVPSDQSEKTGSGDRASTGGVTPPPENPQPEPPVPHGEPPCL